MSKRYGFAKYEGEETPETDAVVQPTRQVRIQPVDGGNICDGCLYREHVICCIFVYITFKT